MGMRITTNPGQGVHKSVTAGKSKISTGAKKTADTTASETKDRVTLSEQNKLGRTAAETTGDVGRKTSKEVKKQEVPEDQISAKDQSKLGEKAAETTGEKGRKSTEDAKKREEVEKQESQARFEQAQQQLQEASNGFGQVMGKQDAGQKQYLQGIRNSVNEFAENHEKSTGQKVDRELLFAQSVAMDETLKGSPELQNSAKQYIDAKMSHDFQAAETQGTSPGAMETPMGNISGPGMGPGMYGMDGMGGMAPGGMNVMGGAMPGGPGQAPPGGPGGPGAPGQAPGGPEGPSTSPYTDAATKAQTVQEDMQQARTIYMQMAAERQKWMMKMWEIIQDMQTEIMKTIQGVTLRRAAAVNELNAAWSEYLRT